MLKKCCESRWINCEHCDIRVEGEFVKGFESEAWVYHVCAFDKRHKIMLKTFFDKAEAETFAEKLVGLLNGEDEEEEGEG